MVRRRQQDRSLFEVWLADRDTLWPDRLKRLDTLLEDEAVIDTVVTALERRWPKSRTRGRAGTPAEVVLRLLILKHLHDRVRQRLRTAAPPVAPALRTAQGRLGQMRPLVERVLHQTRARLLGGDTHVPDKVLSVFEPHTEAIRQGKIAKPTEFGKLVTIQAAEHQIVTAFDVHAQRPADVTLWEPARACHVEIVGRAPDLATADKGWSAAANERAATARGVRRVVLPARGRKFAGSTRARTATMVSTRPAMAHWL